MGSDPNPATALSIRQTGRAIPSRGLFFYPKFDSVFRECGRIDANFRDNHKSDSRLTTDIGKERRNFDKRCLNWSKSGKSNVSQTLSVGADG
jgi:hypothetical protein